MGPPWFTPLSLSIGVVAVVRESFMASLRPSSELRMYVIKAGGNLRRWRACMMLAQRSESKAFEKS